LSGFHFGICPYQGAWGIGKNGVSGSKKLGIGEMGMKPAYYICEEGFSRDDAGG